MKNTGIHPPTTSPDDILDDDILDNAAITATNLSKTYKLYDNVSDKTIDLLGLGKLFFWRTINWQEFSALKDVNFTVQHGERVGIIGQNGAGKTTLLKMITGAISNTGGTLAINGDIQALMQVGLGFHPEFTGRENIHGSLLYSGLDETDKAEATKDIIDFCELGQFLDQPFKTYSLGMRSRLQFACATAIKPDILVIDEVLGAGDAYFSMKSSARMEKLTKSGCTLLLVSHSMAQILQFCERVIWIKDGKVEKEGASLGVVKAYEHWMHQKSLAKGLVNETAKAFENKAGQENSSQPKSEDGFAGDKRKNETRAGTKVSSTPQSSIDEKSRWATAKSALLIRNIILRDENKQNSKILSPDTNITVEVEIEAQKSGMFPCAVVVHIMSTDGRSVIWKGSKTYKLEMKKNESVLVRLFFTPLMLNSGKYTIASALFDEIIPHNKGAAYRYDLISRGYEFAIMDNYDGNDSLFRHPAKWGDIEKIS